MSLAVIPQGQIQCGDIPLYTQNIASPAVMILLDLSGSMLWEIDLVKEGDVLPVTPNLSPVVQEIVNRDGWASGKAMTFIIDKVSGFGLPLRAFVRRLQPVGGAAAHRLQRRHRGEDHRHADQKGH